MNAIEWHFAQGTPCVVLIDEYDDPVARALANPAEADLIRDELAGFYGKIKDRTHMIRFLMIRENGYAKPYLADGRPVWAIGLAFDSQTRQLIDAKAERFA